MPDAVENPAVDRAMQQVAGVVSFVAAPIVADGEIVAFVHADHAQRGEPCDELDRDLLALMAEAAGLAYERLTALDGLRSVLGEVQHAGRSLLALADEGRWPGTLTAERASPSADADIGLLSRRELEVLRLAASGSRNAEIAHALSIGEATVKTHVSRILRKLQATNRAQAVDRYWRASRPTELEPSP